MAFKTLMISLQQAGISAPTVILIQDQLNLSAWTRSTAGVYFATSDIPTSKKIWINGSAFDLSGTKGFLTYYNDSGIQKMNVGVSIFDNGGVWAVIVSTEDASGTLDDLSNLLPQVNADRLSLPMITAEI